MINMDRQFASDAQFIASDGEHGGPDADGVPRWDFSTNANACGPAPWALRAVREADRQHYPDPHYTALRQALAAHHGVACERVVLAASASEFIRRMSLAVALQWPGARVCGPRPGYGDYACAARALGLTWCDEREGAGRQALAARAFPDWFHLHWITQPSSPEGRVHLWPHSPQAAVTVIDRAYTPLQLSGLDAGPVPPWAWQLWSPNKTLGLTGVRASYALAPVTNFSANGSPTAECLQRLHDLAPSWPLGADGVALLWSWLDPALPSWLDTCRHTLREWKRQQTRALTDLGWTLWPSDTPYGVARWPGGVAGDMDHTLAALRRVGIKLRDTTGLGLPHHVRISVQSPVAQQALVRAWAALFERQPS